MSLRALLAAQLFFSLGKQKNDAYVDVSNLSEGLLCLGKDYQTVPFTGDETQLKSSKEFSVDGVVIATGEAGWYMH